MSLNSITLSRRMLWICALGALIICAMDGANGTGNPAGAHAARHRGSVAEDGECVSTGNASASARVGLVVRGGISVNSLRIGTFTWTGGVAIGTVDSAEGGSELTPYDSAADDGSRSDGGFGIEVSWTGTPLN
jgi:hypothetical protein